MVQLSSGKPWLKSSDVKSGDVLVIQSGGEWIDSSTFKKQDGSPVKQFVIDVMHDGQDKKMNLNKISRDNLCRAWGRDTDKWVGGIPLVEKLKVMVAGEMKDSLVLSPPKDSPEVAAEDTSEEIPF